MADALKNYRYAPDVAGRFHNYLIGILKHKALPRLRSRERYDIIPHMRFLEGIGETRGPELLKLLQVVRTHDATAVVGNTLTLGGIVVLVAEARGAK